MKVSIAIIIRKSLKPSMESQNKSGQSAFFCMKFFSGRKTINGLLNRKYTKANLDVHALLLMIFPLIVIK